MLHRLGGQVSEPAQGEVAAIDGKTLWRRHDRAQGGAPLDLVSAWASENRLVLGQTRTADHSNESNEITAIPELLSLLELKGCLITIDAMGCQKNIASQTVDGGSDYLLAVKSNQGELHENIRDVFACAEREEFYGVAHSCHEQISKGHDRRERRQCWVITDEEELSYVNPAKQWAGLGSAAKVIYERGLDSGTPADIRYYICSYPAEASRLLKASRAHWGIENSLRWVLDMAFDEDRSRIRTGHADQNLAVIRHFVLKLLKQETSAKIGIKAKRKKAAWD